MLKRRLLDLAKKHHSVMCGLRAVRFAGRRMRYMSIAAGTRVDSKTVIFESFMGRFYSDNPRAIYEAMLKDDAYRDYKFIWCFRNPNEKRCFQHLKRAKLVECGSREYYESYARAKYIVSNSRIPEEVCMKRKQVYVQTWHGTPLKRLGYDIEVAGGNAMNSVRDIRNKYRRDAKKFSYLVSPSLFCTEKLESAFNLRKNAPKCKIIQAGYPRNDFLKNYTQADVNRIRNELGLDAENFRGKKVILYAPTWRDDQHKSGVGYTYDNPVDFDVLREKLGEEYVILFRAHYFVANSFDFEKYRDFVIDVSDYEDISELYVVSDMLVTDYSSVFFDYAILGRPIIFYMYDLNKYEQELRGFYVDPRELPWPIVKTEGELVEEIERNKGAPPGLYGHQEEKYIVFQPFDCDGGAAQIIRTIMEQQAK